MQWKRIVAAIGLVITMVGMLGCVSGVLSSTEQFELVKFAPRPNLIRVEQPFDLVLEVKLKGDIDLNTVDVILEANANEFTVENLLARLVRSSDKSLMFAWTAKAGIPGDFSVKAWYEMNGRKGQEFCTSIKVISALPEEYRDFDYVPAPKPVKTDYLIGAYYYPGWNSSGAWESIKSYGMPTPLLGYYPEGSPKVADWHIKWAVENGISYFVYDWYWVKGSSSLTHGLESGFLNSKYRSFMKFAIMWSNHNPPKSTSLEDLSEVAMYWIENYFSQPEYLIIDGKPVVYIFSSYRLTDDLGADKVREGLNNMRALAKEHGYKDLYIVAVDGYTSQESLKAVKERGFDAISAYNYVDIEKRWAPYDDMVTDFSKRWRTVAESMNFIDYVVPISPGWDKRPWAGVTAVVRTESTSDKFELMCRNAKDFVDKRWYDDKPKMLVIGAWNEFGEGSYIEPTEEWGFAYLEALRRVFVEGDDVPVNIMPQDTGAKPYDYVPLEQVTEWTFEQDANFEGWDFFGEIRDNKVIDGVLYGYTRGNEPRIITLDEVQIDAEQYKCLEIRIKTQANAGYLRLWWAHNYGEWSGSKIMSKALGGDGFQVYHFDLSSHFEWNGLIRQLRIDPGTRAGKEFEIDYVKFLRGN